MLVGTSKLHAGGSLYDVDKIFVHPKFNRKTLDYDISLLKLKEPLAFSRKVKKIYLFDNSIKMKSGTILETVGWGYTKVSHAFRTSPKSREFTSRLFPLQCGQMLEGIWMPQESGFRTSLVSGAGWHISRFDSDTPPRRKPR